MNNNYCPIPGASQPKEPVRLIDANSLLRLINISGSAYDGIEYQAYKAGVEYVLGLIEDAPTIDPESLRPTAHIMRGTVPDTHDDAFCSNCRSYEVTAKYSVIDLLGDQRASLNSELTAYLKDKFEPYGIIIESVSLINIDPDDETRAAVQKKVNAQQDLELAKIEQQTANVNAEKEKEVAITKANQEKETAQINAEAKLIEAQAQADANRLISQSLTPELIQQQMYEKWNGQLPTVQSGSDTPIIVDTTN